MRKRRIINNRPICFLVLFFALGIIIAEALYGENKVFVLLCTVLCLIGGVGLCFSNKLRKHAYIAFAMVVGMISMTGANDVYDMRLQQSDMSQFKARVCSEIIVADGQGYFMTDKISSNGKNVAGKAKVYVDLDGAPAYGVGDIVTVKGYAYKNEHKKFQSYYSSNNFNKLYFRVYAQSVKKTADGKVGFPTNFQMAVKRLFYENCDEDTANICQALFLGDKSGMNDELYDNIKDSGLAHILAVSGLHITALATALFWLLKKLKVNPKISFAAVTILTFLYVMICSFTPSAMRAFIMTFVFTLASIMGYKKDNLSSLSFAALLIILINPTSLLNVGYLLSVFAVLGINVFFRPISNFALKVLRLDSAVDTRENNYIVNATSGYTDGGSVFYSDAPKAVASNKPKALMKKLAVKVVDIAAVSVSANIFILPIMAFFFDRVQTLFILSNIFMLPYMMFTYIFLLIITLFALITTLYPIVSVMNVLMFPFKSFTGVVGSISFASVDAAASAITIIAVMICGFLLSRYVFLTRKQRAVSVASVLAISTFITFMAVYF